MSEEKSTPSLMCRIGHLFQQQTPAEPGSEKGEAPPPGDERRRASAPSFSALELRDRVVVMLLFDQVVCIEQVGTAWRHWNEMSDEEAPDALWRVVARLPDVDREVVYAQAARVYAFEPVAFRMYGARKLLRDHQSEFSQEEWQRMVELNVALVDIEYDELGETRRWIFATHDPTRASVKRFLSTLDVAEYVLRYASEAALEEALEDVFPDMAQYRHREEDLSLPDATPGKRGEHRRLEDLAHGSSFVETVFSEMESEPDWIEAPPREEASAEA